MTPCDVDIVLYFYGEMDPAEQSRVGAHVRGCADCRQRLDELAAIRTALAMRPRVEAPPAGDWSGFMRRLDEAVKPNLANREPGTRELRTREPRTVEPGTVEPGTREPGTGEPGTRAPRRARYLAALAAMVALVTIGVITAAKFRGSMPERVTTAVADPAAASAEPARTIPSRTPEQILREVSVEHLERSKLVVLGLATRDPQETSAADWQYERSLAGTLLTDTRLYRLAAQDRGVSDVARVMRDLETVLLEASLSDTGDREALGRVQRLINKRDLVVKMQVMAGSPGL